MTTATIDKPDEEAVPVAAEPPEQEVKPEEPAAETSSPPENSIPAIPAVAVAAPVAARSARAVAWRRGRGRGRKFVRRLLALAAAYVLLLRPWMLRWGATNEEVSEELPGDDLIPEPAGKSTRAITIDAPVSKVWPWLVQIGYKRGGFYSYDWLENIPVRMMKEQAEYHSATHIMPELQELRSGDEVMITPGGSATVVEIKDEEYFVLCTKNSATGEPYVPASKEGDTFFAMSWLYLLRPVNEFTTRLVIRSRGDYKPKTNKGLLNFLPYWPEPLHFIMERKTLLGIKERAERLATEE